MAKGVTKDEVRLGRYLRVSFHRTLRIPDDGRAYPLPPSFGRFPVRRVRDFAAAAPPGWRERDGVFIPLYQREALWLGFDGPSWHPTALQVGVGGVNAVSGGPWDEGLSIGPQNYVVCPDQPWLDGINAGDGVVRQFVAMPLGLGYTVEEQLTGLAGTGGIQLRAFEAKPGRFPAQPPRRGSTLRPGAKVAAAGPMGLGAGGRMRQRIYPDPYGLDTWSSPAAVTVFIHVLNGEQFRQTIGGPPPPTPISAKTYTERGFPWFELYDEDKGTVGGIETLHRVKTVREMDEAAGPPAPEDTVEIPPGQVHGIPRKGEDHPEAEI
jgi:hypothetical protein